MAVVVAVDKSASSWEAVRLAALEAQYRQTQLVAVAAYSVERAVGAPATQPVNTLRTTADEHAVAESDLRDAVQTAIGEQAADVELRTAPGPAGQAVIEAAREARAQLIVMGARPAISMLPGTFSHYVLRNARCPVLIVPAAWR